jgi:hypothetical protein
MRTRFAHSTVHGVSLGFVLFKNKTKNRQPNVVKYGMHNDVVKLRCSKSVMQRLFSF